MHVFKFQSIKLFSPLFFLIVLKICLFLQAWTVWREGNVTMPKGNLGPEQAQTPYTWRDVRYTAKGDVVYAFLMAWPSSGGALLEALSTKVARIGSVRLLCDDANDGSGKQTQRGVMVEWRQNEEGLNIQLPPTPPLSCRFAYGLRIDGVTAVRESGDSTTGVHRKSLCPAGFYCPSGLQSQRDCPAGHYCPAGSINPLPCGPGEHCAWGLGEPSLCPCGHSCPSGLNSPVTCPTRYYCPFGTTSPIQCPKGHACPRPYMCSPLACEAGTYQARPPITKGLII